MASRLAPFRGDLCGGKLHHQHVTSVSAGREACFWGPEEGYGSFWKCNCSAGASSQDFPDFPGENPGNPANPGENLPESESNLNQSRIRIEDEEAQPPPNVLLFPAARADAADAAVFSQKTMLEATKQVAEILKLSVTDDLARVVGDYLGRPGLSLLGEADAAAEWLADTQRNRKGQRASPAFFRRWVKRETETAHHGSRAPCVPVASEAGAQPMQARMVSSGAGPPRGSSPAHNPYHTFVQERARQLARRASETPQEEATHETST